jgi:hypothetical protein
MDGQQAVHPFPARSAVRRPRRDHDVAGCSSGTSTCRHRPGRRCCCSDHPGPSAPSCQRYAGQPRRACPRARPGGGGRPVTVRDGGAQALASRHRSPRAGHLGRGPGLIPGLIDEHQVFRLQVELALEPSPAPLQDHGSVLLGRMRRLSLRVRSCRSKHRHRVARPTVTPGRQGRLPSVMSGVRSADRKISAACASMRSERRSPPSTPGTTEPVSRSRAHQRMALDALPPKACRGRSARRACRHGLNHSLAKIDRQRLGHPSAGLPPY